MSVFHCPICDRSVDSDYVDTATNRGEIICEDHTSEDVKVAIRYAIDLAAEIKEADGALVDVNYLADRLDETLSQHIP